MRKLEDLRKSLWGELEVERRIEGTLVSPSRDGLEKTMEKTMEDAEGKKGGMGGAYGFDEEHSFVPTVPTSLVCPLT